MTGDRAESEVDGWLRLAQLRQVSRTTVLALLEKIGGAQALNAASPKTLLQAGLDEAEADALKRLPPTLAHTCDWLQQPDCHLVTLADSAYPTALKSLPDAPAVLFVQGDPDCLNHPQLAIVGSRKPTRGGTDTARRFATTLAEHGLGITSGLALGIDAAAHEGALDAEGITVAVMGTGLDQVYPARNLDLATRIRASGALVSEFVLGSGPRKHHFPARNRLISGLAVGVLVVEAAERSGSLITARLAAEQGREVFAIPGSIHNPMARGCHRLIRDGARLTETVADIFNEISDRLQIQGPAENPAITEPTAKSAVDPHYQKILDAMAFEPATVDDISQRSGLTIAEVSSMLLILELDSIVEALPDRRYARRPQER